MALRKVFIYLFLIEISEVYPRPDESESEGAAQETIICKLSWADYDTIGLWAIAWELDQMTSKITSEFVIWIL